MNKEEKELLYQIADWRIKDFNNEMVDSWTDANYRIASECHKMISVLEHEYTTKYGALPKWKYIDDVLKDMHTLKEELYG